MRRRLRGYQLRPRRPSTPTVDILADLGRQFPHRSTGDYVSVYNCLCGCTSISRRSDAGRREPRADSGIHGTPGWQHCWVCDASIHLFEALWVEIIKDEFCCTRNVHILLRPLPIMPHFFDPRPGQVRGPGRHVSPGLVLYSHRLSLPQETHPTLPLLH